MEWKEFTIKNNYFAIYQAYTNQINYKLVAWKGENLKDTVWPWKVSSIRTKGKNENTVNYWMTNCQTVKEMSPPGS